MAVMTQITQSVYLVISPGQRRGYPSVVREFNIVDLRKGKPALKSGQLAVKVKLNLDSALFDEFIPVVEATIEAADVIEPTVEDMSLEIQLPS